MSDLQPTRLPFTGHLPDSPTSGDESGVPRAEAVLQAPDQESPADNLEAAIKAAASLTAEDLQQISQEQYSLDASTALSLGYSVATLAAQVSHDVLIFQAARYKDIDIQGQTYRFGVAIEAAIVVTTAKFQGALTLPVIAANVQLPVCCRLLDTRGAWVSSAGSPATTSVGLIRCRKLRRLPSHSQQATG